MVPSRHPSIEYSISEFEMSNLEAGWETLSIRAGTAGPKFPRHHQQATTPFTIGWDERVERLTPLHL